MLVEFPGHDCKGNRGRNLKWWVCLRFDRATWLVFYVVPFEPHRKMGTSEPAPTPFIFCGSPAQWLERFKRCNMCKHGNMPQGLPSQEAASWFQRAGDLGHAEAQFNLGEMRLGWPMPSVTWMFGEVSKWLAYVIPSPRCPVKWR